MRNIPLSVPNLKGKELEYLVNAVKSGWVSTSGPFVEQFEKQIATYVGAVGAVSCQNGTAGIHLSLITYQVPSDSIILVPTLTFIAAVNPVKYINAEPLFLDCDESLTVDPAKLEEFCQNECVFIDNQLIHKESQKRVSTLIVVHVFGNMADMERIVPIAKRYNLLVIEDATEALGSYYTSGSYEGKYAGTIGDVGIFSFNGNKIITTGGGGMIVSNNEAILKRVKHLSTQAKSDELFFTHDEVGYNYRMTNLQAALGLAQLEQLEEFIENKKSNYEIYKQALSEIEGLSILEFNKKIRSNYWFYSVYCQNTFKRSRDELISFLTTKNVQSRPVWGLIHMQKPYVNARSYKIDKAYEYADRIINIPCSTNLSKSDVAYVIACLKEANT